MGNKKEFTKQKIVGAAVKLISANGFNATTTASIATEAQISEAIIFRYFHNKQSLLREIVVQALEQIVENVSLIPMLENIEHSKDYPPRQFIKAIVLERFDFLEKNLELIKVALTELQFNNELQALANKMIEVRLHEVFKGIILLIANKLEISPQKAHIIMRIFIGAFITYIIQNYFLAFKVDRTQFEGEIDNLLDIVEVFAQKPAG